MSIFVSLRIGLMTSILLSCLTLPFSSQAYEYQLALSNPQSAHPIVVHRASFNQAQAIPLPPQMHPNNLSAPAPRYTQPNTIWQRIGRNYQLGDHALNPRVQPFIRQYTANPAAMNQLVMRASQYLHIIIEAIEQRNIPSEIALLPLVESGFTPNAASRAGAAGLWQFMPTTGHTYGLIRNELYDGRLDSFASTGAALNYLESLSREFNGDWMLALAAYNGGPNRIHASTGPLRRTGQRVSYWNLSLPKETADYVPRLLAFKEIISNPARYGIQLPNVPNAPMLAQMRINKPVDLRQAALRAGLHPETLTTLNPYFRTGITTPQYSNRIILPRHHAAVLVNIIQTLAPAHYTRFAMNTTPAQWR